MEVKQFHFTSWPIHEHNFLRYLIFHRTVMDQHDGTKGPILVHCRYSAMTSHI